MSDSFDPYYQWLGISPKDQPPNHYRLLGIELFEANTDVISNAADRQMAHLRTYQSGKRAADSQRILNEIAAARLCLLDAKKKEEYDAGLRSGGAGNAASTEPPPNIDGAAFDDYLLEDLIGIGGTGQVFKARHRKLGRIVALKILSREATKSAELVARFQLKVSILGRLSHNNLVAAYDAGEKEGVHYLIMEHVDGWDLLSLMKQHGSLPVGHVLDYMIQAAEGLGYAHSHGIYHRNVKPSNVLIDRQGAIKVIGLGMARFADHAALAETGIEAEFAEQGRVIGTLDFMAPEQARDSSRADHRSDVYSLGCTMFTAITRQLMYPVKPPREKILAHRSHPIPSMRGVRTDAPTYVESVFQKMVNKHPDHRYQSMGEVITALQMCQKRLESEPVPAAAPVPAPAAQQPAAQPMQDADPLTGFFDQIASEQPHWKKKR